MRRLKHNFKEGMAFVLSLAMVAGLVLAMPGGANTVQAATGSGTEPSVTAYATKDQLMTAFTPDANGTATTKGKLVFGKNSDGNPQEWYILGADSGVSGGKDNTIIFAASPIAKDKAFEPRSLNNKTYDASFGDYASNPTEVYPNHYGASDFRVALQNMAKNAAYFTTAEHDLMNDTTVTTKDTNNTNITVTYTTTGKLYALQGDSNNNQYLWAGTSDNIVLASSIYWSSGTRFWLRSPHDNVFNYALCAEPSINKVGDAQISGCFAVQPASNLKLSSVLFASAATAASSGTTLGTIAKGTAMTLRLNGTSKDIGTVTYNTTTGDIKVTKGGTTSNVALAVQGNDGTDDWYYSKKIDTSETINVSAITSAAYTPASIDLSACKIWLEITDLTENLTYAVNATDEPTPIPTSYQIISGADSEWKQNTDETITIGGNGEFPKFTSVKVDGSIIDPTNYTAKEGSTIISLKTDYLKTLSVGTHSFEIVWTDGSAATSFKVSKNTSDNEGSKDNSNNSNNSNDNPNSNPAAVPDDKKTNGSDSGNNADDSQQVTAPQTGDNSHPMLWATLLAASIAGLIALLSVRRKKDDK